MSFVDLPLQFQVKVNEESYNYLHLFRVRVVVYRHSSDLVDVEKADTMKANSKKALDRVERWEPETHKKNLQDIADGRMDKLMNAGVLLGEVYDAKLDEEMLEQTEQRYIALRSRVDESTSFTL
jgi:hypothetical protein